MNFITNNNAPDRKKLVKALSEHFDFDATYAGPPTFNYNVGDITVEPFRAESSSCGEYSARKPFPFHVCTMDALGNGNKRLTEK